MFTWICPKCGKEVPPHESECPACHGTGKVEEPAAQQPPQAPPQPVAPTPPPPPAPPQQSYAPPPPPPQAPAPPRQQYAPPPQQEIPTYQQPAAPPPPQPPAEQPTYYELDQRKGMPPWLVTLLVAVLASGTVAILYRYVLTSDTNGAVAQQQESPFEAVPEAGQGGAKAASLARHIEVTGFRLVEDANQQTQVQFLVVNHSAADIGDLAGVVTLRSTESSPDDDPIAEFEFKTASLGPFESIEFKTAIETSMRAYELPDWQFLTASAVITSPLE